MLHTNPAQRQRESLAPPRFVEHPSFNDKDAVQMYRRAAVAGADRDSANHLPDEATRELAKAMHFSGFRFRESGRKGEAERWRQRYFSLRNQIVEGNRKLVYRAVHSRVRDAQLAEDCAAECHIVLIRAVSAYNPWLGIRFSTYAYTCLLRELTRLMQRSGKDRLRQAVSFDDSLTNDHLVDEVADDPFSEIAPSVNRFLTPDCKLLDDREKQVLIHRFGFGADGATVTLKDIGKRMHVSKERVRQLQNSGLRKLRESLDAALITA